MRRLISGGSAARRIAVVAVLLGVLALAAAAVAVVASADPAPPALTISGDVAVPLYPGAAAQPIDLRFDSPNDGNNGSGAPGTRVSSLVVAITSVMGPNIDPPSSPCLPADFVVTQVPASAYPFYVQGGVSTLTPIIGAANLPTIQMVDRTDLVPGDGTGNQDGCQGATIHLSYTGSP